MKSAEVIGEQDKWEEFVDKYDEFVDRIEEQFEGKDKNEAQGPPMVKTFQKPTKAEWERHQLTHTPYEVWCPSCMAARAVRHKHPKKGRRHWLVNGNDGGSSGLVKISMDYMYLHERNGPNREESYNPFHLLVVEHRYGRIWAYRVPNKGIMDEAEWLPKKIVMDFNNNGMQDVSWHVKIDQEPAIVTLQAFIQEFCPSGVVPTNSFVGESACYGRAENAIKRVQDKARVLRHLVESCMKRKFLEHSPFMVWVVRWAAEVLSKYAPGIDGGPPYERSREEKCLVPLVPFGERVMHLPFQTVKCSKGVLAKRPGIWFGASERAEETLIGTTRGVVKCRTVSRMPEGEQWCHDTIS